MRKLIWIILAIMSFSVVAQNRVDESAPELSFKSKPIKKARYWHQENGKWESRKCNNLVYLGEGVNVENFEALFIGIYKKRRYLFMDRWDYSWRYPNLEHEWMQRRYMYMVLLSDADWETLQNLEFGKQYILTPRFTFKMFKGHEEYSFPFFLSLGETMLSSSETLYDSYLENDGKSVADAYWSENYPAVPLITVKRVNSDVGDVVRFRFGAVTDLIDSVYFEVSYSEWENLFIADKKTSYK